MKKFLAILFSAFLFAQCGDSQKEKSVTAKSHLKDTTIKIIAASNKMSDAATILARKQVPVLCYHHIKDWKLDEKASLKLLLVPVANFKAQIKSLADSGYHTITPDEYYAYLTTGAPLPSKPVMITFDDTDGEQFSIAAAELNKYHFKGVFFIMTIALNKKNYMSNAQLKELSDQGHVIAAHTWDHFRVDRYTEKDYEKELIKPKQQLEAIIGKPVDYFAYPYGLEDPKLFPVLEKCGYKAAYQLVQFKRDEKYPLYSIRRIIVPGAWSGETMQKWMKQDFN
jgi:peptidoglycan/xylan/chitin deacetylase (PgdA/CDA1 family)